MIVFCGDSFTQPDSVNWNWMRQIAKHYKHDFVSLGKDSVSMFDITMQVEHATQNIDYDLLVVCLTTTDRVDVDDTVSDNCTPADYNSMRNSFHCKTLTQLYRQKTVPLDYLKYFGSMPLCLKKSEIYIQHIINMCREKNKPFIIFSNIYPTWNNTAYKHKFDYIVDGPASVLTKDDFIETDVLDNDENKPWFTAERPIYAIERSCHLTLEESVKWSNIACNYIDKTVKL